MMKTKYVFRGLITLLLLAIAVSSCESYNEELLNGIGNSREFSPIGLKATIRNQTTVELNWTVKSDENADHYVVEFSADDPEFKTIYKTVNVTASQLPIQVALEGETVYSIRVKAVNAAGLEDSKWSTVTATTLSEQIMLPIADADIEAKQVTVRWTPNSTVTQIVANPGNVIHVITPAEKTAGVALVTGLTSETDYTVTLYNGTKKRGERSFKTGIDIGNGILVKPEDDLNAKVAAAAADATLVLMPGEYKAFTGEIILDKPITIRGLRAGDKPKLNVRFTMNSGATSLSLIDLELNGSSTQTDLAKYNQNGNYGKLLVSGCNIHDYLGSFANTTTGVIAKIESIAIENSIVTNMVTANTGEFIDFRTSFVDDISLTKSTFNNCAAARAFIRLDAAPTLTGSGLTSNILIDSCTLYKVTNTVAASGYQILYVRFVSNATIVRNSLFAETVARYANQAATAPPTFANNNYHNATTLNQASPVSPLKSDTSGTALDPQFTNAATGDFTIGNQTLKDNKVGDPRWIK
ncbi:DUF5123 domain-containing protein [Flavobacterium hungaricum]|uniref:DUF4957 domain-containing protein n=1 Tax=Flavobacterium hungaricum TaxID=2082725 RepID=A0ABR9TRH0_9FLAO|nr:DUF5123 domain-containing protein [Flavobacterium hungaricum]MBE8727928.1 DUF4957 domain-containing protein [Flavobacterium hungaricum]